MRVIQSKDKSVVDRLSDKISAIMEADARPSSDLDQSKAKNGDLMALDKKHNADEPYVDQERKVFNELYAKGLRLLAMREHSSREIIDKLSVQSDDSGLVMAVVDELISNKYQCNERFTESYIRSRSHRGVGPVKIRAELKNKGIDSSMIADHLNVNSPIWYENAQTQHHKKYGDQPVNDYNEWSKRARFLQGRGFTMDHIQVTVPKVDFD